MNLLDSYQEEVLRVLINNNNKNHNLRFFIDDTIEKLKHSEEKEYINCIKRFVQQEYLSCDFGTGKDELPITTNVSKKGLSYFEDRLNLIAGRAAMFKKLPKNSRELLREILETENPAQMLRDKFKNCDSKKDAELRGIMAELEHYGLVQSSWADGIPSYIWLSNPARNYFEAEKEYEESQKGNSIPNIQIDKLIATGTNIIFGNAVNTSMSIDNSITRLEDRINKEGGEDKEDLKALLEEVKKLIENINTSRSIPKNKGLINRLGEHFEKHGWFYGEIVGLLGTTVVGLLK